MVGSRGACSEAKRIINKDEHNIQLKVTAMILHLVLRTDTVRPFLIKCDLEQLGINEYKFNF